MRLVSPTLGSREAGKATMTAIDHGTPGARPVVRPATAADAAAVAGLIVALAEDFDGHTTVTPDWIVECLADNDFFALVAESDGEVVGVVTWVLVRGLFHGKKSAVIQEASVAPAHQNRGVGRALLEAAVERIRTRDVAEISISTGFENERARYLYRSLGFVEETLMLEQHL
jgi:ribosomal protein S18 acetylase RimI-like enzyme